jgi:hypothetical protein
VVLPTELHPRSLLYLSPSVSQSFLSPLIFQLPSDPTLSLSLIKPQFPPFPRSLDTLLPWLSQRALSQEEKKAWSLRIEVVLATHPTLLSSDSSPSINELLPWHVSIEFLFSFLKQGLTM